MQALLMIIVDAFTALDDAVRPSDPFSRTWSLLAVLPAAALIWTVWHDRRPGIITAACMIAACGPAIAWVSSPAQTSMIAAAAAAAMVSCAAACRWTSTGLPAAACWAAAASLTVFCAAAGLLGASQLLLIWLACATAGRAIRWANVTSARQVAHV